MKDFFLKKLFFYFYQENKAELFLDIVGFRVEVKLKMQPWENATVIDFTRSNNSHRFPHGMMLCKTQCFTTEIGHCRAVLF